MLDVPPWRRAVRPPLRFEVRSSDRHRWLSWLALGGLAVGAALAMFGLPPVSIHGLLHFAGVMDPMCGGTRSVWAAMRGDLGMSLRYNPIGIPLLIGAAGTLARLGVGQLTGRWLDVQVLRPRLLVAVAMVLFLLLGINQQLNVELLRTPSDEFTPLGPVLNALPVLLPAAILLTRNLRGRTASMRDRPVGGPG